MSNSAFGVYLFGLVSTVEGRYKVFSIRTEPTLPILRFRILLAERLGVAHPETLTVWRLNEDLEDDDKRLLQGHEDPVGLFDVTELPESFATLESWISNLERNTLHVVVRVPPSAGAPAGEQVANLQTVDALPPAYSYDSANGDAPYWGSRNAVSAKSPMIGFEQEYGASLPPPHTAVAVAPMSLSHPSVNSSAPTSSAASTLVEHVSSASASDKRFSIVAADPAMGKATHEIINPRRRRRLLLALVSALTLLVLATVAIIVGVVVAKNNSASSSSDTASSSPSPRPSNPLNPFINPSPAPPPQPTRVRDSWVQLYGYDWSYQNDLLHFNVPPVNMSLCGTTCAVTPGCVGGVWTTWDGGVCYLKTVMVNPIPNTLVTAFFETNTSYTSWPKTTGRGVPTADIAKYNATELECGSLCADFVNCRGFEMNPNPTAVDAGCTLKTLTEPMIDKANVTFWSKP
ncbi:hypothetical protein BDZ88DRAFT_455815 [Geranomyces variabilis]|nr:hypothetical protein BDZ88DRAFT_455815 [Geranomyces variabilis]KAJ3140008.1 hypothetical protein HDU90_008911 [Geranomyces variabilis]